MRMLPMVVCLSLGLSFVAHAQRPDSTRLRDSAVLSGVVRDSTGAPIADADVGIADLRIGTRTDRNGAFDLAVQTAGTHDVLIRQFGYDAITFSWTAAIGREMQIAVTMRRMPAELDTIVVRAREERRLSGVSSIWGVVVDAAGIPMPEVEVELYGAAKQTSTDGRGQFRFRRLPAAAYLVRARQLGSTPVTTAVQLGDNETRELAIILKQLPQLLDPVLIRERSGYVDESPLRDFEQRQLWRGARTATLGAADLQRFGKVGLDWVAQSLGARGVVNATPSQRAVTSIYGNPRIRARRPNTFPSAVCVLENGTRPLFVPLWPYDANKVETFEVYGSDTDVTGTIAARMSRLEQCDEREGKHPPYYVIWLKQDEPSPAKKR